MVDGDVISIRQLRDNSLITIGVGTRYGMTAPYKRLRMVRLDCGTLRLALITGGTFTIGVATMTHSLLVSVFSALSIALGLAFILRILRPGR